jgi:tetratricopeptide (TPR) repeat protein
MPAPRKQPVKAAPTKARPAATVPPPAALAGLSAVWGCAALLGLAVLLAWSNSFHGPFILDDLPAITDNPTVKHLSDLGTVLSPPREGQTVTGRPLVNLSLAVNYAISGEKVWSYHALNLAIHLGAALSLFGLVRRTLLGLRGRSLPGRAVGSTKADAGDPPEPSRASSLLPSETPGTLFAFTIALLWALHPLQTGSVTYIAQRAESMCALFYLLTLYCFARGAAEGAKLAGVWFAAAVAACLAGMASKEVMVSAPLVVLLYDRTFVAGGFGPAWRRRWPVYVALTATWILLGFLVWQTGNRGGSAGFGLKGDTADAQATPWIYLLTQCGAIVHYLWLCVWPHPLILDYGFSVVAGPADVWWQGLLLLGLFGATLWALVRRPGWGFLGFCFFAILAPSSSVVPVVTETLAEHRMYLPLAAVVVAVAGAAHALAGRRALWALLGAAVALGAVTVRRNHDYRSSIALWSDNALHRPENYRVHNNLAIALGDEKRLPEAVAELETAVRLKPDYPDAQLHLGTYLEELDRFDEALPHFKLALQLKPGEGKYHNNYAYFLVRQNRLPEAAVEYAEAVRLRPEFAPAHNDYANVLSSLHRPDEALAQYQEALRLKPDYPQAECNLGNLLGTTGRLADAIQHYTNAVQLDPGYVDAHINLGVAFYVTGRKELALQQLEQAVQLAPGNADARAKLDTVRRELQQ